MLTLVGPGGVGKTRLALRLAGDVRNAFEDGVWYVDLSSIAEPRLVPQAMADVLGVRQQPGQSWLAQFTHILGRLRLLLVLDNCEHLVEACAELADALLRACPRVQVLATSLQPVAAASEATWRVPPLSLPPTSITGPDELNTSDAVGLFVARVRTHLPDFALSESNASLVAEICRRLDGLPLALELVAARVEGLGLAEVATRLSDRFGLAVSVSRSVPRRQRALRAALEWSWGLLDENERILLRRLGVFVGGWTLNAATTVCASDGLAEDELADVLGRLVTKSLVIAQHGALSVRYRLLETVRIYALDQMASADETNELHARLAAHMLQFAEHGSFETPWDSFDQPLVDSMKVEEDNLRTALDWAVQTGHADLALRLAAAAFRLWYCNGHYAEGHAWCDRVLSGPAALPARATVRAFDTELLLLMGEFGRAREQGLAALSEYRARGDARGMAVALMMLGNEALQSGNLAQAASLHEEAARHLSDAGHAADILNLIQRGHVACLRGDSEQARQFIEELDDVAHARQHPVAMAMAL
jgi:non-specific serine/threonine protein kinase